MNKQIVVHPYNDSILLLGNKKELIFDTHNSDNLTIITLSENHTKKKKTKPVWFHLYKTLDNAN